MLKLVWPLAVGLHSYTSTLKEYSMGFTKCSQDTFNFMLRVAEVPPRVTYAVSKVNTFELDWETKAGNVEHVTE
jgi:hypothetical protein